MMVKYAKHSYYNFQLYSFVEVFVRTIISALVVGLMIQAHPERIFNILALVLFGYWSIRPLWLSVLGYINCLVEAKQKEKKRG